ncbi:hypothetical protein ACFV5J_11065 [Streptomyces zaomyceticus]|uniref:hypothetical protein n=1 Tax=Streptomyces zaomyceticus TaxID=68286 RepID=UPI003650DEBC
MITTASTAVSTVWVAANALPGAATQSGKALPPHRTTANAAPATRNEKTTARPERSVRLDVLLSTLLVADDDSDSLNLHRDISRLLGRPLPSSDTDLIDQLAYDRTQLHNQR